MGVVVGPGSTSHGNLTVPAKRTNHHASFEERLYAVVVSRMRCDALDIKRYLLSLLPETIA